MSETSSPYGTPRGPGRRLDEARVVAAALAILDEGGPSALSIRSVAARLKVRPNALYTYVADRASLERAVAEDVLRGADIGLLLAPAGSAGAAVAPRERLRSYAAALRGAILRHPGSAPLLLSAPMDGPNALTIGEGLLASLEDAGLAPDDAARAAYLLIVVVIGGVALEVAETDGRAPLAAEAERIEARRAAMDAIPPGALPRTAAAADTIAAWIGAEQADWMLERVLDGILSRSARPR